VKDARLKCIENILILSGDHLYRMDYMDFVQVSYLLQVDVVISSFSLIFHCLTKVYYNIVLQKHVDSGADISVACVPMDERSSSFVPFKFVPCFFLVIKLVFSWLTKQYANMMIS
jgi:glucose-1-phosphate adenylyltransferase